MKQTRKPIRRILCMILAIVMVMSMLPATVFAAEGKTLYLKPNSNWLRDNARFAMYCFGNGEKWVSMSDADGDGFYEGTVPAGYPNVIFCRMNPSATANNWNNKWNQTGDLKVPTNDNNCYTVKDGTWDKGGGTWSHIHSFTATVTPPTCNDGGYTTHTCACGKDTYTDNETVALGHEYADGKCIRCNQDDPSAEAPEEPEYITVYFRNDWLWPEVYVHYWDNPSGQATSWPGEKMTKVDTLDGQDIYSIEIPDWATGILFNGNNQQTPDITDFADGDAFYIHWDGKNMVSKFDYTPPTTEEPEQPDIPDEPEKTTKTVYFRNDWLWPEVNVHYWDNPSGQATSWPGEKMTKVDTLNGQDVYSIEIPDWATGILFNGNNQQTPDITDFADGDAFYIHWDGKNMVSKFDYTPGGEEPEPEEPTPNDYYLVGYINGKDYNEQDYQFDNGTLTVTFQSDSYVVVKDQTGDWYLASNYCQDTSVILTKGNSEKMFVPAGSEITFTLVENNDGTLTLSYVAKEPEVPAEPVNNVTIHFRNIGMWSKVHAYGWLTGTDTTVNGGWPGNKLTENADHKNWYTVELTDLKAPAGIGILFNNGGDSGKTGDIMINADGEYWYDGQLLTEAPDTWKDGSVRTVSYQATLHFADAKNWGHVNLYTWTDTSTPTGSWPGTALAQGEDGFYSMTLEFEAPEGQGLNFIFSGAAQTVDLKLDGSAFTKVNNMYTTEKWVVATTTDSEGKFYADIVDAPEAIAVSPKVSDTTVTFQYKAPDAASVSVAGTMNDWNPADMTKNAYGVWSVELENVVYGLHQYKFIVDGKWLIDPLNSWIYTEASGNQNSAFLISDPSKDTNTVKINVHYDAPSAEWNVCAWGAKDLAPQYDFSKGVATIVLDGRANQYVAFKVRKSVAGNDWAEQSGEIRVDLANIVSGTIDIWVGKDFSVSQSLNADVVYANKVKSVELNYDSNTIVIQTAKAVADAESAFAIYRDDVEAGIIEDITVSGGSTILSLTEELELVDLYRYKIAFLEDINEKYQGGIHVIGTNTVYASDKFAEEFTYDGELGALWTEDSTTFRVWAPTAKAVSVNLYTSGTQGTNDLIEAVPMAAGEDGTWVVTVDGDLNGTYYTYAVTVDGETVEAVDPYARTTGVNGKRGMVIDLDSTDPEGWENDRNPNPIENYSDAILYELHVRDFSIDDSSGVSEAHRGKYLAFTEEGTTTAKGVSTGIDYLEDLGITHLHLLPVYDYGSVDETKCENFNWGYDPVNYNTPEGSYSTDPYNGEVRVKEFKEMVMALHEADISVIMDVVYNHVYDAGKFSVNQIVPRYFSRVNSDGSYSNGSGCGNDTASEREMVRKYIVESVLYWHQEYHIDGFRFDLVGLLDETTINEIVDTVHACCPDVIFYGEGWTLGTAVEPGNDMATQANAAGTPDFAYFSDTIRNLLAGSNGSSLGFVSGQTGQEEPIANNFMASPWWSNDPQQIVQYASCHDNYTLVDKLILSTKKNGIDAEIIKMNNLAAAIYMTSQGIPFIHAGEEFLREKLEEDGGRCENSYNASDYVNHIEWSNLENETYAANAEYYKGLIEFRKAHKALRLETRAEINQYVKYSWITNEVVMFTIDGKAAGDVSDKIVVIFNANKSAKTVNLPAGDWYVCVNGQEAGAGALGKVSGKVNVDGISAMVLVQGGLAITATPDEVWATSGDTLEVSLETLGEGLTYQWYYKDVTYGHFYRSTITSASYCVTATPARNGRQVYCVITDKNGNQVTSDVITLIVRPAEALKLHSQPADVEAVLGEYATVELDVQGEGLTYQWYYRDVTYSKFYRSSITSSTYQVVATAERNGRRIYCVITDALGNQITTDEVTIHINPSEKLEIVSQPTTVEGPLNQFLSVELNVKGNGLTYQWYYRDAKHSKFYPSSIKDAIYKIELTQDRMGRQIYCVITDALGNQVTTDIITLQASCTTQLRINSQPAYESVAIGQTVRVMMDVQGEGLTYQWYFRDAGATSWTRSSIKDATYDLTLTKARLGRQVYCVITDAFGNTVETDIAVLKALCKTELRINSQPSYEPVVIGQTVRVMMDVQGEGLTYQWYFRDAGATSWTRSSIKDATYSLTLTKARLGRELYCVITDAHGNRVETDIVALQPAS